MVTYFGRLLYFYKRHFISYWSSKIASQANSRAPHRLSRNGDPPTDKYGDMPCPSERRTAVASSSKNFYDADWQHTWYPVWVSGDMVLQMVPKKINRFWSVRSRNGSARNQIEDIINISTRSQVWDYVRVARRTAHLPSPDWSLQVTRSYLSPSKDASSPSVWRMPWRSTRPRDSHSSA